MVIGGNEHRLKGTQHQIFRPFQGEYSLYYSQNYVIY